MQIFNDLKQKYNNGNIAVKLIFWNIGIYILSAMLLKITPQWFVYFADYTFLNSDWQTVLTRPWTLVSYAFLHSLTDVLHLAFNMLVLYFSAKMFFTFFREKDFLVFYLFGGIFGGLLFVLLSGFFDYNNTLVGASAAVYAILFAVAAYRPKMPVQFAFINISIPLDYMALAFVGMDLLMILLGDNNIGGRISHLGGAAFGWFYMKQFERGNDFIGKFFGWMINAYFLKPKSTNAKFNHHTKNQTKGGSDYAQRKSNQQKKLDEILEKISANGYGSLTKAEKDFLFKASKNK